MKYKIWILDNWQCLQVVHECTTKRDAINKVMEIREEIPWNWDIEVTRHKPLKPPYFGRKDIIRTYRGLKDRLLHSKTPCEVAF